MSLASKFSALLLIFLLASFPSIIQHYEVSSMPPEESSKTLSLNSSEIGWNIVMIEVDKAWATYYLSHGDAVFGRGVIVALLDTGVDYTHPEIAGKVAWCYNAVTGYRGYDISNCRDTHGHGTRMAGILLAGLNGFGITGVAPNVTLYIIKVYTDSGYTYASYVARGIMEALKGPDGVIGTADDASIILIEAAFSTDSTTLRNAVKTAYDRGAIVVAPAGNSGSRGVAYPARYPWVIAVGAVDSTGARASFSAIGSELDFMAPGVRVPTINTNGGYTTSSGTSPAAPHVASIIATIQTLRLAEGKKPLSFEQVYEVLKATAKDLADPGFDPYTGWGLVDADDAIAYALRLS